MLITGGAGFIGSHLAEYLLRKGDDVTVIDDLSTGSVANIDHLKSSPRLHYRVDSILRKGVLAELVDRADVIYHLAASVGVKLVVDRVLDSIDNNVRGTEYVLELASKKKKKVLIASTSEVYGRGNRASFSERDDLMMGPTTIGRWAYACGKAMDEYLAFAYASERGLPVTVVRLFNTVGERQSDAYGMVVPTFVRQALTGEPLTVFGTGKQSRCFCHVGDVVWALHKLMEHPESDGQVYNVGSNESVTIDELADRVIAITGSASSKTYIPYEQAYGEGFEDIDRRVPNIEKVRSLIGFQPTKSLDEIILAVHEHLARQLQVAPQAAALARESVGASPAL